MVMRKRLDNGSNGFQVPTIPRAPRSIRRRSPHKKLVADNEICAFELLASVAGKLLQESESSTSSNASETKDQLAIVNNVVKQEHKDVKPIKTQYIDQGTHEQIGLSSDTASRNIDQKFVPKEEALAGASFLTSSDYSGGLKSEICQINSEFENSVCKVEVGSPNYGEQDTTCNVIGDMAMAYPCSSKDLDEKNPDLGPAPSPQVLRHRNGVSLGNRDDDEKSYSYSKPLSKMKLSRLPSRIGDRRIRKLLTSKYWKVAPKLKDFDISNTDGGVKSVYRKRKIFYQREWYQHDIVHKRRKLFDRSSVMTSNGGLSSESGSNSPAKVINANEVSSSVLGHQPSFRSKGSHVKFSIKSFKVPELFIEVPETTTVGSLKRTVMEAVTALLGGGLRVGVVLQGKKIRDDNRTLLQTGISGEDNLDNLGFTLEPNAIQAAPGLDLEFSNPVPEPLSLATLVDRLESNHESVTSHTDNTMVDSRALVPAPAMGMGALEVVPLNQKPVQRRTRRPFSVTEVEALVESVEQLGTGRWRDVKLCAFEDADHRTYVDLKDKWKTLVHTAKIAPQQRRGEPVPQQLLDRVLAAHGYWTDHHGKQHRKLEAGAQKTREADYGVMDRIG